MRFPLGGIELSPAVNVFAKATDAPREQSQVSAVLTSHAATAGTRPSGSGRKSEGHRGANQTRPCVIVKKALAKLVADPGSTSYV